MTLRRFNAFMIWQIIALVFMGACSDKKERPSDILSHNEMVKALTNVYLAEQITNRLTLKYDSSTKILYKLKSEILAKNQISDSAFNKSYNYYVDRPTELEEIYTALVDSLTLKEQLLNISTPPVVEKR